MRKIWIFVGILVLFLALYSWGPGVRSVVDGFFTNTVAPAVGTSITNVANTLSKLQILIIGMVSAFLISITLYKRGGWAKAKLGKTKVVQQTAQPVYQTQLSTPELYTPPKQATPAPNPVTTPEVKKEETQTA